MAFSGRVVSRYPVSGRGFVVTVEVLSGDPEAGDMLNEFLNCRVVSAFNKRVSTPKFKGNKRRITCDVMVAGKSRENIKLGNLISGQKG